MTLKKKSSKKLEEELFKLDVNDNDGYILSLECTNPGHNFRIGYIYIDNLNKKLTFSIYKGVLNHFRISGNISNRKHYCLHCKNVRIFCIKDVGNEISNKLSEESIEMYKDSEFVLRILEKNTHPLNNLIGELKIVQKNKDFYWRFEKKSNYRSYEKSIFSENFVTQIPKRIEKLYKRILKTSLEKSFSF